jgi:hypothetical protein
VIRTSGNLLLLALAILFFFGCTKLDTTTLGSDLIPEVDNINTFADTLDITSVQGLFNDTTKVNRMSQHVLGQISGDPLFGDTKADIYVQFKPPFFPYYYGQPRDTINPSLVPGTGFDSVVLCLSYKGFWGDSTVPISVDVLKIDNNQPIWDSVYQDKQISYFPSATTLVGSKTFDVRALSGIVRYYNGKDSASNQLRIRLTGLEPSLFQLDTLTNNSFRTDSLFRLYLNGLALRTRSGRGLVYFSLSDENTKVEVHYRKRNGGSIIDTTFSNLRMIAGTTVDTSGKVLNYPSATANNIVRNRPALPSGSQEIFMQTQPGTYADIFVDSLSHFSNRIIHRASIQMEQLPYESLTDSLFSAPPLLYMDLKDTTTEPRWKPVYFDLNPNVRYDPDYKSGLPYYPTGGVDFNYFGGYTRYRTNPLGQRVVYYDFNLTKHVQQIAAKGTPNYHFRLYAPYSVGYPQYYQSSLTYGNRMAAGRIRLAGGNHPSRPMKMVVIYSKLP